MIFVALTSDQQIALLKRYDREAYEQAQRKGGAKGDRHVFGMLKELTTLGYFTSRTGRDEGAEIRGGAETLAKATFPTPTSARRRPI